MFVTEVTSMDSLSCGGFRMLSDVVRLQCERPRKSVDWFDRFTAVMICDQLLAKERRPRQTR